jgi:NADH:ubiquinone oxidoreductase subunit B-like Fe-S oxidoreductase
VGSIDQVLPVNVYVPGCPPRPEAIIYGVAVLLESLKAKPVKKAPKKDNKKTKTSAEKSS